MGERVNKTTAEREQKEKLTNLSYSAVAKKEKDAKELLNHSKQHINKLEKEAVNSTNFYINMNRKRDANIDKTEAEWKANSTKKEADFKKDVTKKMEDARKKLDDEKKKLLDAHKKEQDDMKADFKKFKGDQNKK